jgi:hypothetical protein
MSAGKGGAAWEEGRSGDMHQGPGRSDCGATERGFWGSSSSSSSSSSIGIGTVPAGALERCARSQRCKARESDRSRHASKAIRRRCPPPALPAAAGWAVSVQQRAAAEAPHRGPCRQAPLCRRRPGRLASCSPRCGLRTCTCAGTWCTRQAGKGLAGPCAGLEGCLPARSSQAAALGTALNARKRSVSSCRCCRCCRCCYRYQATPPAPSHGTDAHLCVRLWRVTPRMRVPPGLLLFTSLPPAVPVLPAGEGGQPSSNPGLRFSWQHCGCRRTILKPAV